MRQIFDKVSFHLQEVKNIKTFPGVKRTSQITQQFPTMINKENENTKELYFHKSKPNNNTDLFLVFF